MPWRACSVMEERLRFVARLLEGESMSDVCRAFGISRKTGYKLYNRYKDHGLEALTDRSRRPVRYANQLPLQVEGLIVAAKREKPHWGARKLRELLVRRLCGDVRVPARSTVHAVLDRHGLVVGPVVVAVGRGDAAVGRYGPQRPVVRGLQEPAPAEAGGEFKLGNGRYCYPLTVTDHASRTLLMCEAHESVKEVNALDAFQRLFAECGLPIAIRSVNGVPFASPNGLYNLSKLSVWWLRLGIAIERIKPGHPHQNGRHERMHLTLKKEATRPPAMNGLQQQACFDAFLSEFNAERPHEALAMKTPTDVYRPSPRSYDGLPEVVYPFHDRDILVTACGRISDAPEENQHLDRAGGVRGSASRRSTEPAPDLIRGHLAGQLHALRSRIHRFGTEDPANHRQPVRHEVVTHVLGQTVTHVSGPDLEIIGAPDRIRTCDLCLRRAALYPAELRVPSVGA